MDCAGTSSYDSYTRYRTAAAAVMHQAALRENTGNLALLMALSVFWGYVLYVAIEAMI